MFHASLTILSCTFKDMTPENAEHTGLTEKHLLCGHHELQQCDCVLVGTALWLQEQIPADAKMTFSLQIK